MTTSQKHTALVTALNKANNAADIEQAAVEAERGQLDWEELCELPAFSAWQSAQKELTNFEDSLILRHFENARKAAPAQYAKTMAALKKAGMTLEQAMVSSIRKDLVSLALRME